jgi:hypothetical protein
MQQHSTVSSLRNTLVAHGKLHRIWFKGRQKNLPRVKDEVRASIPPVNEKGAAVSGGSGCVQVMSQLLKLGRDAVELGVEARADRIDRGNDHDRNAGGNQTIFNRGGAGLILQKSKDLRHLTRSMWLYAARPYRWRFKEFFGKSHKMALKLLQMPLEKRRVGRPNSRIRGIEPVSGA